MQVFHFQSGLKCKKSHLDILSFSKTLCKNLTLLDAFNLIFGIFSHYHLPLRSIFFVPLRFVDVI